MGEFTLEQYKQLWQLLADEWNVHEVCLETPVSTHEGQMSVVYKAISMSNKEPSFQYRFNKDGKHKDVEPMSETTLLKVLDNIRKDLLAKHGG